jgi:hypothetical protein
MRHLQAVVLALASGVIGCCCLPDGSGGRGPVSDARRATEGEPGQVILLDVALIERPRGDAFLDQELWELGNEQGMDLESKPTLEENGLHVGQIGGLLPARLQALLRSPRSCPNPRRLQSELEQPTSVQVGPPRPQLAFQVHQGKATREVALAEANCFFEVTATPASEGRLRLKFTPLIRHGKARVQPHVEKDPDGPLRWAVEAREPIEEFPKLAWELTVGPEEYVLVGPRLDRPDSLGAAYFLTADPNRPMQKLLVLRAIQLTGQGVDETLSQAPPLALQAAWTARGSSQ